mmetsp:Transcript_90680/g.234163  ORF Transcript_90680/g.234163 Transcript_90680/m.234163 type:complete len:248 (+) Transcript_90680:1267-2010(+)
MTSSCFFSSKTLATTDSRRWFSVFAVSTSVSSFSRSTTSSAFSAFAASRSASASRKASSIWSLCRLDSARIFSVPALDSNSVLSWSLWMPPSGWASRINLSSRWFSISANCRSLSRRARCCFCSSVSSRRGFASVAGVMLFRSGGAKLGALPPSRDFRASETAAVLSPPEADFGGLSSPSPLGLCQSWKTGVDVQPLRKACCCCTSRPAMDLRPAASPPPADLSSPPPGPSRKASLSKTTVPSSCLR